MTCSSRAGRWAARSLLVAPGDVEGFTAAIARTRADPRCARISLREARRRSHELTWEHSERELIAAYAALAKRR